MKQYTTPPQHHSSPDENATDLLLGRLRADPSVPIFELAQEGGDGVLPAALNAHGLAKGAEHAGQAHLGGEAGVVRQGRDAAGHERGDHRAGQQLVARQPQRECAAAERHALDGARAS